MDGLNAKIDNIEKVISKNNDEEVCIFEKNKSSIHRGFCWTQ